MNATIMAAVPGACVPDAVPASGAPAERADGAFAALVDASVGDAATAPARDEAAVDLPRGEHDSENDEEELLIAMAAVTLFGIAPVAPSNEWGLDAGDAIAPTSEAAGANRELAADTSGAAGAENSPSTSVVDSIGMETAAAALAAANAIAGDIVVDTTNAAALAAIDGDTTNDGSASPLVASKEATPSTATQSVELVTAPAIGLDMSRAGTTSTAVESETAVATDGSTGKTPTGLERAIASVSRTKGRDVSNEAASSAPVAPGRRVALDALQRAWERMLATTSSNAPVVEAAVATETSAQASGSIAARLAKALERASAGPALDGQTAIVAFTETGGFGEASPQADGARSMPDPSMVRLAVGRLDSSAGAPFTIATPATLDLRSLATGTHAMSGDSSIAIPERDVVAQLVHSMRMQFRDGIGEAILKLKPEHLGTVSISLRLENGVVSANVHAGVPAVRQWLESHQDLLRDSLADQGLRLERFVVEPDGKRQASQEDARDPQHARRRRPQRRTPGADDPIFEILA